MQYEGPGIWQGHSLYDYIGSHLGYRLTVKCVKMKITWFGKAEFIIEIENTGFGRLFQEAELFLTIESEKIRKEIPVSIDLREIFPGTTVQGKAVTEPVPGKVFLRAQRKKDGQNIRFANKNSAESFCIGAL